MSSRIAAALAALSLLVAAPVALAHQGNPNYRSVVSSISPPVKGLNAEILNFDDAVLLQNQTGEDITIFDYENPPKPYAQLLADGTVQVNTNSKAYYLNEDRLGQTAVPENLSPAPNWKVLSRSGRFEWHDHRMHWMGSGDPPQLKDKTVRQKLYDWTIPAEVGGQATTIAGSLSWVPLDGNSLPLGAIFAFAGLIIVLAIAVIVVRRRRSSGDGGNGAGPVARKQEQAVEAW